jgi:hypothetical protein
MVVLEVGDGSAGQCPDRCGCGNLLVCHALQMKLDAA